MREFSSLEAGLSLMPSLPPDDVAMLLGKRAHVLRSELRVLDAMLQEGVDMKLPELFLVEGRFRRAMLAAELEFVQSLAADLGSATMSGVGAWRRIHELRAEGISFEEISADPVRYLGEEGRFMQSPPAP